MISKSRIIQFTAALMLGCISLNGQAQTQTQVQTHTQTPQCNKTVYLTFDTGNMSVAQAVADILSRQHVKATFFLANEKTSRGDYSLDDSWKPYWQELARQGHHFGSHTYDHTNGMEVIEGHQDSTFNLSNRKSCNTESI